MYEMHLALFLKAGCDNHNLESLTSYIDVYNQNRVRMGVETHTRTQSQQQQHTQVKKRAQESKQQSQLKNMLKSLSNESTAWSRSLGVVDYSKCAYILLHGT
jgi:cell shape-determining protein MreC